MEFGILSTAGIGQKAVLPAIESSDHRVGAIASRNLDRAREVAAPFSIPRYYGSYEALFEDDEIDAVYIPVPNALHAQWTKRAADAGLHVLCEKPLASDANEAREVVEHCADRGITVMVAFMYRYHPRTERAIEIAASALSDVRSVSASFQFPLFGDPEDIRLNPALAGGSLMDVGCYAVSAARRFLGEPDRVYAHADDSRETGVDTSLTGILEYDDGSTAQIASSFDTPLIQRYRVEGSNGWLEVTDAFDAPTDDSLELTYEVDGERNVETFDPIDQYRLEVEHLAECVDAGVPPRTDGTEAIANMRVIDALYESAASGAPVSLD
ncbi:Gfo/Idh/MocA family protein [Halalkalirubrum salinum]|uniref:Gfo/Idh/MocA family protein n=1 Tax=Halalkalirubrum salinum TaxID=2563889 RepID=UPI0010FB730F|nr:Gfo/Idh/MocA family oxidoreductase [Halalkalirubrum salinum]